jgi:hypothetical protein
VDSHRDANFSGKHNVSIFRAKNGDSMFLQNVGYMPEPTWHHNPEKTIQKNCENLRSHNIKVTLNFYLDVLLTLMPHMLYDYHFTP